MIEILLDIFELCEFFFKVIVFENCVIFFVRPPIFSFGRLEHALSERHRHLRSQPPTIPPVYNLFFFILFYFDSEHLIVSSVYSRVCIRLSLRYPPIIQSFESFLFVPFYPSLLSYVSG